MRREDPRGPEIVTGQALVAAGFSARQILLYGLALLAMVSLGAAFILVALSGWRRESLSAMVVESGLIAAVGGITARYREKSDAEKTAEELSRIVNDAVAGAEAASKPKQD